MEDKIRVIVKEFGKPAEIREIKNDYQTIKSIIGDSIDFMQVDCLNGVNVIVDDEMLLKVELKANFAVPHNDNVVFGTCIICGNGDEDFSSLTDEQIKLIKEYINEFEIPDGIDMHEINQFELAMDLIKEKQVEYDSKRYEEEM